MPPTRTTQDVNGDERADMLLTGTADELGLKVGEQVLCVAGGLPDENLFRSCVPITLAAAPAPTPTATTEPSPTATETANPVLPTHRPTAAVGWRRPWLIGRQRRDRAG